MVAADEQKLESHFKFGENWSKLIERTGESHVEAAARDISTFMRMPSLRGLSFLDIGCGSGLSSLAAYRLGASSIVSVDIDPKNIDNTRELRRKFDVPDAVPWEQW